MENTLGNKAKFFALYLDQEVYCIEGWNRGVMICDAHKLIKEEFNYLKKSFLELKPISSISDDDAIEVARLCGLANACIIESTEDRLGIYDDAYMLRINYNGYIYLLKNGSLYHQMALKCYDFLRSKGYSLPWMGLSVEKLIEYGWIKLKGE